MSHELWAIACYFNPTRSERRRRNYEVFRKHLELPLVTVELCFDGALELSGRDAERLVQLRARDVMWQKERLLNIALAHLPSSCTAVAWIDTDVVFTNAIWISSVEAALDAHPLVQPFRRAHYLRRDARLDPIDVATAERVRLSLASGIADGLPAELCLVHPSPDVRPGTYASGLAWAARRDLLERHGFFDANVIGGGDRAMACAAYGTFSHAIAWHGLNEAQRRYYLAWAEPFHGSVRGRVGFVDTDICHLWHGELRDRGLGRRHGMLSRMGFDPYTDIDLDEDGCWSWGSDKPSLHRCVNDYFAARKDDG